MSKTMTRFLSLLLIAVLAISLCGCGGEGKKTESNQIKLEDYELLYKDACIMTDSDGNDAVVLTLDFTNNSKESASYIWSINETLVQNGEELEADAVLYATGRVPLVQGLGLEAAGVRLSDKGAIEVDAQYRTSVPSILAAGDVTARVQLTPVALAEAMVIVDTLFGAGTRTLDYEFIPTAVFTHPSIGTVGYTEEAARARFGDGDIRTFRSEFKALRHTLSSSTERTLMKLVVQTSSDRVVGLHMVGAEAGEIVQGFAVALRAGATKAVFDSTIGIHPTVAEEFVTMRE